jgi:type IV secretion system protein TrbL
MTNFDVVGTFIQTFLNSINFGYSAITPSVDFIMGFMIVVVITLTAGLTWIWGDWEGMIRGLVGKILLIGFVLLLVNHWEAYSNDVDVGLTQLGLKAGGTNASANTFLENPQSIVAQGFLLCQALCANADNLPGGGISGLQNLPTKLIYGIAAIGVFLAYAVMALQIFVAYIEFKIINLAALVFVPFAIWPKTEFLSQRAIGYMFSAGTKLFVLALVISIGQTVTVQFSVSSTPDMQNALAILIGSLMLMALAISAPQLAQALISGGPQLGAANAAMGAAATAGVIGGAGVLGGKALGQIGAAGGAVTGRAINNVNQSGVEQMRRAATVSTGGNANATTLNQMAGAAATNGGGSKPPTPPSSQA